MTLPSPIGRQKEVLGLPSEGHFVILGTAGSGKTTLAILRSAYLSDPNTNHFGNTLLVTFNRALVSYLNHLKDRELKNVTIENYHVFARGYLNSRNKLSYNDICGPDKRTEFIKSSLHNIKPNYPNNTFLNKPIEFYSDEIKWINQHGITDFDNYYQIERIGRYGAKIEKKYRKIMFEIFQTYKDIRNNNGYFYDWDDIACEVESELKKDPAERLYRHIIIDEGQDFSPMMLRSLVKAIPKDGSLTLFGDMAQQIYGHRISWRSAGLSIGKVWEFKENYRNTIQIAKLGLAISKMDYFKDITDLVEPSPPTAAGPLPTLVKCKSLKDEIQLICGQAQEISQSQTIGIFFKSRNEEILLPTQFKQNAIRIHHDLGKWTSGPGIWYGTYHSAKGLEFDSVILPFLSDEKLPDQKDIELYGKEDAMIQYGRLLYVGVTRAKIRLIMTYTNNITKLLPIDKSLYGNVIQ